MPAAGEIILASHHAPIYVGENSRTTSVGSITGTEVNVHSYTFPVVAGVRYKATAIQYAESTQANDNFAVKLRWATGNSTTSSSTQLTSANPAAYVASKGVNITLIGTFVPSSTGNATVACYVRRSGGGGTVSSVGGAEQINLILIERYQ